MAARMRKNRITGSVLCLLRLFAANNLWSILVPIRPNFAP